MKGRDFERLGRRQLLPELPGFRVKGRLLFASPIGAILRGINAEPATGGGFYATAFVMPLYLRWDVLVLTYGRRLRSGSYAFGRDGDEQATAVDLLEAIREQGLFILDSLATPEAFSERLTSLVSVRNIRVREALAYTRAWIGASDDALELLRELEREARVPEQVATSPWLTQVEADARRLREAIEAGEAHALLSAWRAETLAHLRLSEFAADAAEAATTASDETGRSGP